MRIHSRLAVVARTFAYPLTIALGLALAAQGAHGADVDLKSPQPTGLSRTPTKIALPPGQVMQFARWKNALQPNDVIGEVRPAVFCSGPRQVFYTKSLDDWLHASLAKTFHNEAVAYGFSASEDAVSLFDDKGSGGADYRVGATLMAFDYRTCGNPDKTGSVYAKVKWEIFSVRRQQVVYSATIDNLYTAKNELPTKDFDAAMMRVIVDNLLADPGFVAVIQSGGVAAQAPVQAMAPLQINAGQVIANGVDKGSAKILTAVVTVESGMGSGTAFYVSQDGYLLTNKHVVGDDKFVRVKLSTGRSLVGEVVRVDKERDVALLRTDPFPGEVLALRPDGGTPGEAVFVVGSPFGQTLSGTITRGVLSAHRLFEGVPYLQSDVAVNPGNSGGPMLDANGRVIGITVISFRATQGINLFVPIDDALEKLSLTLNASPVAAAK